MRIAALRRTFTSQQFRRSSPRRGRSVTRRIHDGAMTSKDDARSRGLVRNVEGRDATEGGKGLPKLSAVEIEPADGRVISATALPVGPTVR